MIYVTVRQSPQYRQMTLDEFLFSTAPVSTLITNNETNTRTYTVQLPNERLKSLTNPLYLTGVLQAFNKDTAPLREKDRSSLYNEFYIPKKSGGLRKIDAPVPELMDALRRLKRIFETDFGALYHTTAFAYVKGRSTIDAVKRHQSNESRWFAKFDLSNFFGSTTPKFVMSMLCRIFPFSEVCALPEGREALRTALDLAFLNGGLPQGTPISPTLTNIMMIPIDHTISNVLHDYNKQRFVYTRYADDFIISSRYGFSHQEIAERIMYIFDCFNAPFQLKPEKTRYGSRAGQNWNLGLMLNKDNEITVGAKNKRRFKAMLTSYVLDHQHDTPWDISDIRVLDGLRSYYKMVEGKTIDDIVSRIGQKFGVNIPALLRTDLTSAVVQSGTNPVNLPVDPEGFALDPEDGDTPW